MERLAPPESVVPLELRGRMELMALLAGLDRQGRPASPVRPALLVCRAQQEQPASQEQPERQAFPERPEPPVSELAV